MFSTKKQQQIPIVCKLLVNGFIKKYGNEIINIPLVILSIINIYYYYSYICFDYFNKKKLDKRIDLDKQLVIATKEFTVHDEVRIFGSKIINCDSSYLFNYYSKYILYIWQIELLSNFSDIALGIHDIYGRYYRYYEPLIFSFTTGTIIYIKLKIRKNKIGELSYAYQFINQNTRVDITNVIFANLDLQQWECTLGIQFGFEKTIIKLKDFQIILN